MEVPALISISGTQSFEDERPETIQLVTQGTYRYEPGYIVISYTETEMTGLEGVVTSFFVEESKTVTLQRVGRIHSTMVFSLGKKDESLYDAGFGALLIGVDTQNLTVLLNEHGGILDIEYALEIEQTPCGVNGYHIEIRTL